MLFFKKNIYDPLPGDDPGLFGVIHKLIPAENATRRQEIPGNPTP